MGAKRVGSARQSEPLSADLVAAVEAIEPAILPVAAELQRLLEKRWKHQSDICDILRVALATGLQDWLKLEMQLGMPPEAIEWDKDAS